MINLFFININNLRAIVVMVFNPINLNILNQLSSVHFLIYLVLTIISLLISLFKYQFI